MQLGRRRGGFCGCCQRSADHDLRRGARERRNRQTPERRSRQGKRISVGQRHGRGIRPAAAFAQGFLVDDAARDGARDERAERRPGAARQGAESWRS